MTTKDNENHETDPASPTTDEEWRKQFPMAAAQPDAVRADYQKTADQRRAEAMLAAQREAQRQAHVSGEPVPTGEGENIHANEPDADPEGESGKNPEPQL